MKNLGNIKTNKSITKKESKVLKNLKNILKENYGKKISNSLSYTEVKGI